MSEEEIARLLDSIRNKIDFLQKELHTAKGKMTLLKK